MSRDDVTQTKIYIVKIECKIHSIWEYNRTFLKHNRARFTLDRFKDTKDRPFFFFLTLLLAYFMLFYYARVLFIK